MRSGLLFIIAILAFYASPAAAGFDVRNQQVAMLTAPPRPPVNQLLPEEEAAPVNLAGVTASSIRVLKGLRRMDMLDENGNTIRSYKISLGKNPVGRKEKEGDERTPEGLYYIDGRNPKSDYHLSLKISYPQPTDLTRAKQKGVRPGGSIFIHGKPNGKSWMWWKYAQKYDWTNGCIAVSNEEIEEIWRLIADGTPIEIKP